MVATCSLFYETFCQSQSFIIKSFHMKVGYQFKHPHDFFKIIFSTWHENKDHAAPAPTDELF